MRAEEAQFQQYVLQKAKEEQETMDRQFPKWAIKMHADWQEQRLRVGG